VAKLLNSPAKINLGLRILGRNLDNYHLIESIFLPLDFGDQIEISPSKTNSVSIVWDESAPIKSPLPNESENIVTKLLSHLANKWEIIIRKKIPLGAGLGGGSSNAGSILKYFVSQSLLNEAEAHQIAIKLGADVPFFLNPKPSWVSGIGEKCTALPLSKKLWNDLSLLLVLIPEHCNTKQVFTEYKNSKTPFSQPSVMPVDENIMRLFIQSTANDLEAVVAKNSTVISQVLMLLRSTPYKFCSLSGSGSTCFAMYQSKTDCELIVKELSNSLRKIGCKTVTAKILHAV